MHWEVVSFCPWPGNPGLGSGITWGCPGCSKTLITAIHRLQSSFMVLRQHVWNFLAIVLLRRCGGPLVLAAGC